MAGVFPPQGSAAGGLTGVTEDGGSPVNVVTVADALNVGTATDATAAGDFAAGLDGAARAVFDQSLGALDVYDNSTLKVRVRPLSDASVRLASDIDFQWSSTVNAGGTIDLSLARSAAGRLEVSDPSGSAGGRIDLLTSAGSATVYVSNASNTGVLSGTAGVALQFNGSNRFRVDNTHATPGVAGGTALGSTGLPWNALTLGDGTAQVTLGHDGALDGRVTIEDPNGATGGALALLDTGGNADLVLTLGSSNTAIVAAQSGNLELRSSGSTKLLLGSNIQLQGGADFMPQSAGGSDIGNATLPWGDAHVAGQGNAASLGIKSSTEVLSALSGASASTTNLVPAGCTVLYVVARVTTLIEGATTFDIGDGSDVDRYGAAIALAAGTTVDETDGTADPRSWSSSAQDVTLTANGSSFTAGAVRITAFYLQPTAPTS